MIEYKTRLHRVYIIYYLLQFYINLFKNYSCNTYIENMYHNMFALILCLVKYVIFVILIEYSNANK